MKTNFITPETKHTEFKLLLNDRLSVLLSLF